MRMLKAVLADDSGSTVIEFGLLAALVSVAAIATLGEMGESLETLYSRVKNTLKDVVKDLNGHPPKGKKP